MLNHRELAAPVGRHAQRQLLKIIDQAPVLQYVISVIKHRPGFRLCKYLHTEHRCDEQDQCDTQCCQSFHKIRYLLLGCAGNGVSCRIYN